MTRVYIPAARVGLAQSTLPATPASLQPLSISSNTSLARPSLSVTLSARHLLASIVALAQDLSQACPSTPWMPAFESDQRHLSSFVTPFAFGSETFATRADSNNQSIGPGAIAGIVIAVATFLLVTMFFFWRSRQSPYGSPAQAPMSPPQQQQYHLQGQQPVSGSSAKALSMYHQQHQQHYAYPVQQTYYPPPAYGHPPQYAHPHAAYYGYPAPTHGGHMPQPMPSVVRPQSTGYYVGTAQVQAEAPAPTQPPVKTVRFGGVGVRALRKT